MSSSVASVLTSFTSHTTSVSTCPICTNEVPTASLTHRLCCHGEVCRTCLRSHLESVVSDCNRLTISCPLGCGGEVNDADVRSSLASHPRGLEALFSLSEVSLRRLSEVSLSVVIVVLVLTSCALWSVLVGVTVLCGCCVMERLNSSSWSSGSVSKGDMMIDRYERWSITVGLAKGVAGGDRGEGGEGGEHVIHCPLPDCSNLWVVSSAEIESKRKTPTTTWWTTLTDWVTRTAHSVVGLSHPVSVCYSSSTSQPSQAQGWRVVCEQCHLVFCCVCLKPWTRLRLSRWWRSAQEMSHEGRTCENYGRGDDGGSDYNRLSDWAGAKMCPGCTIRVDKSGGCNHIRCRCGAQWCFVCLSKWSVRHYECR
eukprot:GHVN01039919.1.p1 GENE.GHVN01039919.1~~GHVN01039919.1.p1  ORF type:complete len:367 (-),score=77.54 GHVN01039919.1:103-1203(-)